MRTNVPPPYDVQVWRGGNEYQQDFSRGAPLGPMTTTVRYCLVENLYRVSRAHVLV
jgi:hypothetical protein